MKFLIITDPLEKLWQALDVNLRELESSEVQNVFPLKIDRVVMTVYFTTIFEGYHLKIKLLKKSHNFYFPAKCNN